MIIISIVIVYLIASHIYLKYMMRKCNASKTTHDYSSSIFLYPYILLATVLIMSWLFLDDIFRWKKYKFWRK